MANSHIIEAKVIDHAFDSRNAIQYFPGDVVNLDLADPEQRKLVWLKTLGGKRWVFQFDRANSSNTAARIFFCKVCGQPFDKFTDLGNHTKSSGHDKISKVVTEAQQANEDEEEELALAKLRAAEEAEEQKAKEAQQVEVAK